MPSLRAPGCRGRFNLFSLPCAFLRSEPTAMELGVRVGVQLQALFFLRKGNFGSEADGHTRPESSYTPARPGLGLSTGKPLTSHHKDRGNPGARQTARVVPGWRSDTVFRPDTRQAGWQNRGHRFIHCLLPPVSLVPSTLITRLRPAWCISSRFVPFPGGSRPHP